jgi:hypothetical protein
MIFYDFYETIPKKYPAWGLKKGPHEKYNRCFPEGVQKEEIQQWRQARSRPEEKKPLNIMLREKT